MSPVRAVRTALVAATVAAGLAAAACTVSRQGTLALVPGGPAIPLQVSVSADGVVVEGVNPGTGERLRGTLEKTGGERGTQGPWGGGSADQPVASAAGGVTSRGATELRMNLAGTISGDLGTSLRCVAEVERRLYLRGGGSCVATGGEPAPAYVLKF